MTERDAGYLLDMLIEARRVVSFVEGADRDRLDSDEMFRYALIRGLCVLGEAAAHVSEDTRAEHPDVPWHAVIGMRHRLVHDYRGIDLDRVWYAATEGVRSLVPFLDRVVPPPPDDEIAPEPENEAAAEDPATEAEDSES